MTSTTTPSTPPAMPAPVSGFRFPAPPWAQPSR